MKKIYIQAYKEDSGSIPDGATVVATDGTLKIQTATGAVEVVNADNINTVLASAGSVGIKDWEASTAYAVNDVVRATVASPTKGIEIGDLLRRKAGQAGTSATTFTVTEAGKWEELGAQIVKKVNNITPDVDGNVAITIPADITVNNTLTSTSTTEALSAAQGKSLKDTADMKAKAPFKEYSVTATYTVGEQVIQDLKFYMCKTAITAGETFTASKWDEISVGATGAKTKTIHHAVATNLAITEVLHNNAEIHLEGTGNLTILNTDVTSDTFGFTVINTDAGATRTLTPTGFAGVFKRSGGTNTDLGNVAFNIADNEKYRLTVTLNGGSRYLNIENLNTPAELVSGNTIKTVNGASVLGSGNIVITTTTVSSTVPTHDLDLVADNYAGRALHLRPDGMTATANLTTWSDSSGNGNDAVQATPANQPQVVENVINGLPAVTMNGDFLKAPAISDGSAYTIIAVAERPAVPLGGGNSLTGPVSGVNGLTVALNGATFTDNKQRAIHENVAWFGASTNAMPAGWGILGYVWSDVANLMSYFLNGAANGTAAYAGSMAAITEREVGTRVGNTAVTWGGKIAEIVVFNTVLAAAERQKVEGYLAHKYGLLASLDAGHPYKVNSPLVGDLPTYADNAAATTAGLTVGTVYMSADGLLRVVF